MPNAVRPIDLENDFHNEMLHLYERWKKECNWVAKGFLKMVTNQGGLQAAKRLLESESIQKGLMNLWEQGRLDISVEATVLQDPWRKLFSVGERAVAKNRLMELGYIKPSTPSRPDQHGLVEVYEEDNADI